MVSNLGNYVSTLNSIEFSLTY